ncbi:MAG: aldehyde ferredoxin oxidoreductase [Bacillota bacterium]|nr:aldehyde ferredoxin oxidoreductase [Bacillota bacterium]
MWKTKRINMTKLTATEEDFKYLGFGGTGVIAKTMTEEIDPKCDPLGPDNKLIIACTATAGTGLSSAGRISFGAKSPLTFGIKEANAGGQIGNFLARHGIMEIIIEGQSSDKMYMIFIDKNGQINFIDAENYKQWTTYNMVEKIVELYGSNLGIAVIGPAGERGYKNSSIQINQAGQNYPCRAAARGGLGAVMGSRGVKAIVVEKADIPYKPDFVNPQLVKDMRVFINKEVAKIAPHTPLHSVGTPDGVKKKADVGALPLKNFSCDLYNGVENLYSEKYQEIIKERGSTGHPCMTGCIVSCAGIVNDKKGKLLTAGCEYETIALCGANCGMTNYDDVLRIDRLCDEAGIDTIEFGGSIAVAMEGGHLKWGDGPGAIQIAQDIIEGKGLCDTFGNGCEVTAKYFNVKRIPVTKHQSMPGYDPRGAAPTGLAFALGTQGADHTQAPAEGSFYGKTPEEIFDVYKNIELTFALVDNTMCMMNFIFMGKFLPELAKMYSGCFGGPDTVDQLFAIAKETLILEKEWNKKAGWTPDDNTLPDFFFEEISPKTGHSFSISKEDLKRLANI